MKAESYLLPRPFYYHPALFPELSKYNINVEDYIDFN